MTSLRLSAQNEQLLQETTHVIFDKQTVNILQSMIFLKIDFIIDNENILILFLFFQL